MSVGVGAGMNLLVGDPFLQKPHKFGHACVTLKSEEDD